MRQAFCPTRVTSPRQLLRDHDYAVSTREYQSDQPSQKLLDRLLALSLSWGNPDWRSGNTGCCLSPFLLTPVSQNAPRRQGLRFAAPKPGAPLTAAVRSVPTCRLRRKGEERKNKTNIVRLSTGQVTPYQDSERERMRGWKKAVSDPKQAYQCTDYRRTETAIPSREDDSQPDCVVGVTRSEKR
jgi:hypothetical protein